MRLLLAISLLAPACTVDFDESLLQDSMLTDVAWHDGLADARAPDGPTPDGPEQPDATTTPDLNKRSDASVPPDLLAPDSLAPDLSGGKDLLPQPDATADTATGPDAGPDLSGGPCDSWASWSCSIKSNNAVGRCPATGTQIFSLVCNTNKCACTRLTGGSKNCVPKGQTCAEVQASFAQGCCAGL